MGITPALTPWRELFFYDIDREKVGFCPNPRFKDGADKNDYIYGWCSLACALIIETVRDEPWSENASLYNRLRPPVWTVGNTKQQCACHKCFIRFRHLNNGGNSKLFRVHEAWRSYRSVSCNGYQQHFQWPIWSEYPIWFLLAVALFPVDRYQPSASKRILGVQKKQNKKTCKQTKTQTLKSKTLMKPIQANFKPIEMHSLSNS